MVTQKLATFVAAVGVVVTTIGCTPGTIKPLTPTQRSRIFNMPERATCAADVSVPTEVGTIESADLVEASGVVASPTHKGVLWMHNDSGDTARIFAVSTHGNDLGQLVLPAVNAIDFEDIAAAPCPDLTGPCIYIADTGDNALARAAVVVYAVPEPDVDPEHPLPADSVAGQVWRFPMAAPDGPIDVEAMVVLPDMSAIVLYEKFAANARIFRYSAPWTPDVTATLEITGSFTAPGIAATGGTLVTGADIHPTGTRLALRTYGGVAEVKLDPASGITADHFTTEDIHAVFSGPASEPQGEAIGYDEEGTGLFLVSESPDGSPHQPLHHADCP